MITFQRTIQALSLGAFLTLLLLAAFPVPVWAPVDAFLRMDPVVALSTLLATRVWVAGLGLAVLILALSILLGRFFCGYLCPMGTTLDLTDRLCGSGRSLDQAEEQFTGQSGTGTDGTEPKPVARPAPSANPPRSWRRVKYLVLFFILGAASLGVSAVFLAAPLALITRFYALLVHPLAALLSDALLHHLRPLALHLDWTWAAYADVFLPRFTTQWFLLLFFLGVFSLARWSPRFWCRNLCPSGAVLALIGCNPLVRRTVSADCTGCGACQRSCPMAAIPANPMLTDHAECITCQHCVRICPTQAVAFALLPPLPAPRTQFSLGRRQALLAGLSGAGAATLTFTGLNEVRSAALPGDISPEFLIRPPGSLPERDFLARCIRCGLCMRACLTNTLQPIWFQAGVIALFSPQVSPRRGPCDPGCTACGQVCPTGAIRNLTVGEKTWAKIGTAMIHRQKCLAWKWDKKCLVCDEVCPYDAIQLRRATPSSTPLPFVQGHKCSGCGFCEFHCPVRASSAIVVEPMEALRLAEGSYIQIGQSIGLSLVVQPLDGDATEDPALIEAHPGQFDEYREPGLGPADPDALPPGFSP